MKLGNLTYARSAFDVHILFQLVFIIPYVVLVWVSVLSECLSDRRGFWQLSWFDYLAAGEIVRTIMCAARVTRQLLIGRITSTKLQSICWGVLFKRKPTNTYVILLYLLSNEFFIFIIVHQKRIDRCKKITARLILKQRNWNIPKQ